MRNFVSIAALLAKNNDVRSALSVVYLCTRELINGDKLEELDGSLNISVDDIPTDVLVGLLTATAPVKSSLPSRREFFEEVEQLLKNRGHLKFGILDGLR